MPLGQVHPIQAHRGKAQAFPLNEADTGELERRTFRGLPLRIYFAYTAIAYEWLERTIIMYASRKTISEPPKTASEGNSKILE